MVWYGLALGAIVGPDADKKDGDGGVGGTKSSSEEGSGGQGLFSVAGHDVYGYIGGIAGFGEKAGVYGTTGPMIGWGHFDWAIGGGVHLGRRFGLGVVVPVYQTLQAASAHSDKAALLLDKGTQMAHSASATMANAMHGGLEQMLTDPMTMLAGACVVGVAVVQGTIPTTDWGERISSGYRRARDAVRRNKKF